MGISETGISKKKIEESVTDLISITACLLKAGCRVYYDIGIINNSEYLDKLAAEIANGRFKNATIVPKMNKLSIVLFFSIHLFGEVGCSMGQQNKQKTLPIWYIEYSDYEPLKVIKGGQVDDLNKDHETIIKTFNDFNDSVFFNSPDVIYCKTINDTITVTLDNPEKYSEQMGTDGARDFLICLVFNMTEITGVNYIHLDIEIGSHGKPGVFSRNYLF